MSILFQYPGPTFVPKFTAAANTNAGIPWFKPFEPPFFKGIQQDKITYPAWAPIAINPAPTVNFSAGGANSETVLTTQFQYQMSHGWPADMYAAVSTISGMAWYRQFEEKPRLQGLPAYQQTQNTLSPSAINPAAVLAATVGANSEITLTTQLQYQGKPGWPAESAQFTSVSGMAWFQPFADQFFKGVQQDKITYPAWTILPQPAQAGISGIAWFQPFQDKPRPGPAVWLMPTEFRPLLLPPPSPPAVKKSDDTPMSVDMLRRIKAKNERLAQLRRERWEQEIDETKHLAKVVREEVTGIKEPEEVQTLITAPDVAIDSVPEAFKDLVKSDLPPQPDTAKKLFVPIGKTPEQKLQDNLDEFNSWVRLRDAQEQASKNIVKAHQDAVDAHNDDNEVMRLHDLHMEEMRQFVAGHAPHIEETLKYLTDELDKLHGKVSDKMKAAEEIKSLSNQIATLYQILQSKSRKH